MKIGSDIAISFPGIKLIHHNLPQKKLSQASFGQHILFIPLQGEMSFSLADDEVVKLGPGKMLLMPAKTVHTFHSSLKSGERLIALIDPKLWSKVNKTKLKLQLLPLNHLIQELLFYLLVHKETKHANSMIKVFLETLSELMESANSINMHEHLSSTVSDERVKKLVEYLAEHYQDEVKMPLLAKLFGLGQRSLNRLIINETGMTPKQILTCIRIQKAQEKLLARSANVSEVAYEVGYNSLSQFIKAYQKQIGMLPSETYKLGQKA